MVSNQKNGSKFVMTLMTLMTFEWLLKKIMCIKKIEKYKIFPDNIYFSLAIYFKKKYIIHEFLNN